MQTNLAHTYTDRSADRLTKSDSQLGFTFAPISWEFVDSDLFRQLSGEAIKLHVYLTRHVDLRVKESAQSGRQFIKGQTFTKTYQEIKDQAFPHKSIKSISRYKDQLEDAGLITCQRQPNDGYKYHIKAYQDTKVIKRMESNWRQQRTNQTKVSATNQTPVSASTIYKKKQLKETSSAQLDTHQPDIPNIITEEISDNGHSLSEVETVFWQKVKTEGSARRGVGSMPAVIEDLSKAFGVSIEMVETALIKAMPNMPLESGGQQISSPNWIKTGARWHGGWFKDQLKKEGWTDDKPKTGNGFSLSFASSAEKLTPENSTGFDGKPSFKKYADAGINKQESSLSAMKRLFPKKRQ
jgi:hypothetical protein